jgi:hypothetical protein
MGPDSSSDVDWSSTTGTPFTCTLSLEVLDANGGSAQDATSLDIE